MTKPLPTGPHANHQELEALLVDGPIPASASLRDQLYHDVKTRWGMAGIRALRTRLRIPDPVIGRPCVRAAKSPRPVVIVKDRVKAHARCEGCDRAELVDVIRRHPGLPTGWMQTGRSRHPWPVAMWCQRCQGKD